MNLEGKFPVGKPVPRIDSFEIVGVEGPELTDDEKTWPVVAPVPQSDSFEIVESVTHPPPSAAETRGRTRRGSG